MANFAFVTCQSPYQLLVTTRGHAPCPLVICRQPGEESLLQSGKAVGCHPPPCLARRHRENRNAIYTFGKPYARRGMVLPGKFVRVLKIEGKCSCLRAKAAHISGHLPARSPHCGNCATSNRRTSEASVSASSTCILPAVIGYLSRSVDSSSFHRNRPSPACP